MIRATLAFVAAALLALPAPAQTRNDLDAAAALALARSRLVSTDAVPTCRGVAARAANDVAAADAVKAARVVGPNLNQPLTLAEALTWTRETHRPVLVRVGPLDCSSLCVGLRPQIPTCHAADLAGDRQPQLRLIIADSKGDIYFGGDKWTSLPAHDNVKAAARALKAAVDLPPPAADAQPVYLPAAAPSSRR